MRRALPIAAIVLVWASLAGAPAPAANCTPTNHCRNSLELGIGEPPNPLSICNTPPGWSGSWLCVPRPSVSAKFQMMQIGGIPGTVQCRNLPGWVIIYAQEQSVFQQFEYWYDTSFWALSSCR